jgi:bacterioferritin-associated ferredoxin
MIVCLCHRVSDRDIARAAHAGCESFEDLQASLHVATGCGRCGTCARETLAGCHAAMACAKASAPPGQAVLVLAQAA